MFIIPRRSGTDGRFGPLLEGRSPEWRIYSGLTGRVCMGTSRSVTAAFVDLPQLMDALRDFTGLALPAPDGHETDVALALDLFRYLADQRFKVAEPTDAQLVALLKTFRSQSPVRKLLHRLNNSDATKAR